MAVSENGGWRLLLADTSFATSEVAEVRDTSVPRLRRSKSFVYVMDCGLRDVEGTVNVIEIRSAGCPRPLRRRSPIP